MVCIRHIVSLKDGICFNCKHGEKGKCTYGVPVCRHDERLKCRFEMYESPPLSHIELSDIEEARKEFEEGKTRIYNNVKEMMDDIETYGDEE